MKHLIVIFVLLIQSEVFAQLRSGECVKPLLEAK